MKRTDLAAPSVIDPGQFTFAAGIYFGNPGENMDEMLGDWMGEKAEGNSDAGWFSKRAKVLEAFPTLVQTGNFFRKNTCDHCGAAFRWGSVYTHINGTAIVVGNICADKTMSVPSRHELEVKRLKARLDAHRQLVKSTALAVQQAEAQGFAWLYQGKNESPILDDIADKGRHFGGLTPRQIELVKRIHDGTPAEWEVKKAARVAQREREEAEAMPVPDTQERIVIIGRVLTLREQEDNFSYPPRTILKMLVLSDAHFKVWGTVPRDLDPVIGDRVQFSAKVQRSDKDATFGFYSRPTKASKLDTESKQVDDMSVATIRSQANV